jgi:phosphoenolpyruvate carboxykinase (ATP)
MLIRESEETLNNDFKKGPDFTVLNAGEFWADPLTESLTSQSSICVNFTDHELVILGT